MLLNYIKNDMNICIYIYINYKILIVTSIDGICKSTGYIYVYDDNSMFCVTYYYVHTVMEKLYWFYILNGIGYTY